MVSQILPRDREEIPRELRPLDPARDLGEVARVIEVAFADELSPGGHVIMRDLRLLNLFRPVLWVITRAIPATRDLLGGYVWEADGRVVGNVTVSRGDSGGSQWIISNVAVLPAYRRQGIAKALVEAAIQHARARGGVRILLQVRTENVGARTLYEKLNFRYLESITEMVSDEIFPINLPVLDGVTVREPVAARWYEAYELARVAVPAAVQRVRPLRTQHFRVRERSVIEDMWSRLLRPARERWWAEVEGRVMGLLTIDRQLRGQPVQLEILVHPQAKGRVEAALINRMCQHLHGRQRIRASIPAGLTEARALLCQAGFHEIRTLDHMTLDLIHN